VIAYWWWLDKHGLTRKQVDEDISLDDHEWFPKLDAAKARVIEMKQKAAAREARGSSRHGQF
jgi:hypothetical protein